MSQPYRYMTATLKYHCAWELWAPNSSTLLSQHTNLEMPFLFLWLIQTLNTFWWAQGLIHIVQWDVFVTNKEFKYKLQSVIYWLDFLSTPKPAIYAG